MASGIELKPVSLQYTVKRLQEILEGIKKASVLKDRTEKRIILRRYIKGLIYSKEAIEVSLFYSANGSPAFINSSGGKELHMEEGQSAAVFCLPVRQAGRRSKNRCSSFSVKNISNNQNILPVCVDGLGVRSERKMEPNLSAKTISLIIPNIIHGCKRRNIGKL